MEILLNEKKIAEITKRGLDINGYISLVLLKEGSELKIDGFTTTGLMVLGYLGADFKTLTPKSVALLNELEGKGIETKAEDMKLLYDRIVVKFIQLTGKKQKMIDGKYAFIPNYADFSSKLNKVVKKYKLTDKVKLEKVIIAYICRAHKANFQMVPLLGYYIEKNNVSPLVNDYENFEEGKPESFTKTVDI